MTNAKGEFWVYATDTQRVNERGRLIPPNSVFDIVVEAAGHPNLFPFAGQLNNTEPHVIKLTKPEHQHTFQFVDERGEPFAPQDLEQQVSIQFERPGGLSLTLSSRSLYVPIYSPDGVYRGRFGTQEYQSVTVADGKPSAIAFRPKPRIEYRGRIMAGVSGEPLAAALVFGYSSTGQDHLTMVSDEQWLAIAEADKLQLDSPELEPIRKCYSLTGVTRSAADGTFTFQHSTPGTMHGIIAVDRAMLPIVRRISTISANEDGAAEVGNLPLFPAAKVLVQPIAESRRSISSHWQIAEKNPPNWSERLKVVLDNKDLNFATVFWLDRNERQTVFVPATTDYHLEFRAPYDEKWGRVRLLNQPALAPGATSDLGRQEFPACAPATVKVVDKRGEPVEGIPVRKLQYGRWTVAHNTSARGEAFFFKEPNSSGQFGVPELRGEIAKPEKTTRVEFKIASTDTAPTVPYLIVLTDDQIEHLVGPGPDGRD
jgi:hypothetical protein